MKRKDASLEVRQRFRDLVDRISITEGDGEAIVDIFLSALALLKEVVRVPKPTGFIEQIKLVAGVGFEPMTFRS